MADISCMESAVLDINSLNAPAKLEELGIPLGLCEDLFMRRLLTERISTVGEVSESLCIAHAIGNEIAESLREKQLVEYLGVDGRDYRLRLTEQGHRTTAERMKSGRHVSRMPVPVALYNQVVLQQKAELDINRGSVKKAFSDLVLEDVTFDQIGPAFLNGGAIFFYGPPGTGKTSIAERLGRIYEDAVLVPRLIESDGQLISVYDPAIHKAVEDQPKNMDPRWVLCERPVVMVGGELDLGMMDLQYDNVSGISGAPIQMLANNGILIIDDFGRQRPTPDEILNRWIVPLAQGIDFLKPNTGNKFTIPFEVKLIISTNLEPESLGDDALLRRLRNKVFVGACTEAAFNWILARVADVYELKVTSESAAYLCKITREQIGELRPYVAADFCEQAASVIAYDHLPSHLDNSLMDRIADQYFTKKSSDGIEVGATMKRRD